MARAKLRPLIVFCLLLVTATVAVSRDTVGAAACTVSCWPPGVLVVDLGGSLQPERLPRRELKPVTASTFGSVKTTDGSHPSALREAVVDIDKDVKIDVEGLPVCKGQARRDIRDEDLETRRALELCGDSVVGLGNGYFALAFPEQKPLIVNPPITVFNGGERNGEVKLLIHTFISVPVPRAIVAVATIRRKGGGLHAVVRIPPVAGGAGSLVDFRLRLGPAYARDGRKVALLEGRCPDGKFKVSVPKLLFRNEARVPGIAATTTLAGSLSIPCTPKG